MKDILELEMDPSPVPSPSWSRCSGWIEKGQNIYMQAKPPLLMAAGAFALSDNL